MRTSQIFNRSTKSTRNRVRIIRMNLYLAIVMYAKRKIRIFRNEKKRKPGGNLVFSLMMFRVEGDGKNKCRKIFNTVTTLYGGAPFSFSNGAIERKGNGNKSFGKENQYGFGGHSVC